ncbi:hypothetical protein LPJ61_002429 [Coemansia biformis]|uniref:DH domain-containing protein n=1 Tax=Coemansia biformis TaxID=1286918 RepID=A0A9W7YD43_9FUNG|nr:hypothetical protein LPJ61_002429 [Coemansia biformis]
MMNGDSQQSPPASAGQHSAGSASSQAAAPSSRCALEIPNENENDGQYVSEFWLNALVPKPHTNFFGYESSVGPICISISTRESHECYKALVRTPFKFGVVYVPTMVIDEPVFGTDLDRLSSPTPQKILLYHALRLYFQQADDERRGYLLTALRNQRLSAADDDDDAGSGGGEDGTAIAAVAVHTPSPAAMRASYGLPAKRSMELRRAEISDFVEGLFDAGAGSPHAQRSASFDVDGSEDARVTAAEDATLLAEIYAFLAAERAARDLAVATESLTEIRDDHLKPLLRNLEPKLYRRRMRLDFVVVSPRHHSQLTDMAAPHRRFLRALERASARLRGDPGAARDSPRPGDESTPEKPKAAQKPGKRKKTREELETKRSNVVQELIATERSYVEKLRTLIDLYSVPLRSAARSANNALIPAYDAHVIFGNIERVTEVNERFLGDLEAWQLGEMDPKETIGSLCRDHFVDFHVYKRYINGYQHALSSSRELEAKNPLYAAFLQKTREREECRKLGISDLLIMPVQRIPRYTLLLTDLLKTIPEDDPDVPRIRLAMERVNEIGQLADNQVAESVAELHHIHTTIEGCPPNLISASREFIGAVDVSEIDLATGAPKRPMCLLVFSDLLMIVERFWPPKGHGGIRVTGKSAQRDACPIHAHAADLSKSSSAIGAAGAGLQSRKDGCSCGADLAPPSNAFLSTTAGGPNARKRWGRFTAWVDIARVSLLEKSQSPSSRSFFIHRYPVNAGDSRPPAADSSLVGRQHAASSTPGAVPKGPKSSGSSIVSLDSAKASPVPSFDAQAKLRAMAAKVPTEQLHQDFARILYPVEATYESYGDHGYWYPQSLHEFEADHSLSRDAFFEFLNTAWERSIARCFESTPGTLSRHGSSSGAPANAPATRAKDGGRRAKPGASSEVQPAVGIGHPELDRVDVGGQSWTVRIWDSADYVRSRQNCPSALVADMTVVWDYRQTAGSPGEQSSEQCELSEPSDMSYYPLQACRVVDYGDDYFHVTSTVLPLDAQHGGSTLDTYAELIEEHEAADNWSALCRLVEQAIVMYQYVLLAYPEHRRVQQCYNRSILASLFGQNALGSSSSVKTEAVSAAPRKLFSRAKHLFSSGKNRASGVPREAVDTTNLFSSAYSNAVAADTVGPSSGSSPYNPSTITTPLTVLGRYKLKTKNPPMVSSRRVHTLKHDPQHDGDPPANPTSPASTPTRKAPVQSMLVSGSQLPPPLLSLGETAKPPANKRKGSDMSVLGTYGGRKPSHTFNELPLFSSSFDFEPADTRSRSRTSPGSRIRSSSISSPRSHAHDASPSDALEKQAASLAGSTSSLVILEATPAECGPKATSSEGEMFVKRRTMSVVSVASASSIQVVFGGGFRAAGSAAAPKGRMERAPTSSTTASAASSSSATQGHGLRRGRDDCESEFSLQLDLQPHSKGLDIPSDLKLEFDVALSGAGTTPPGSVHDLGAELPPHAVLPMEPSHIAATGAAESVGLNVLIPLGSRMQDTRQTWETQSPDDRAAGQQAQLQFGSTESLNSRMSTRSGASGRGLAARSLSRRRGVYGVPVKSPAPVSAASPPLVPAGEPRRRRPDILLDIARELGEDEPFSPPLMTSPLYVDEEEIVRHLDQMSVMRNHHLSPMLLQFEMASSARPGTGDAAEAPSDTARPLPPFPLASRSASQRRRQGIPQPPQAAYSLQQQQKQQEQQPTSLPGDYRRLPSLPPRVRSTAAPSFLDRSSSPTGSGASADRPRLAHPPF